MTRLHLHRWQQTTEIDYTKPALANEDATHVAWWIGTITRTCTRCGESTTWVTTVRPDGKPVT